MEFSLKEGGERTTEEWSFEFLEILDAEETEPQPIEVKKLNQLAIAIVKYNEMESLAHRVVHRRLGWSLLVSIFATPPSEFTFEYDEELADGANEPLHRIYFIRPHVGQVAYFAFLHECGQLSQKQLEEIRETLPRLHQSLFPARLLH